MKNNKNILYLVFVIALLFVTVGYAVINSTFNINGKSNISKNIWDVHLENIKVTDGSVEAIKAPIIVSDKEIEFEAKINLPGEFYEFSVDVVNNGTIDAMVESIIKEPELTDDQKKYLNYIIEYQNREEIKSKQLLKANEFVRLKVKIEIKKDVIPEDLPNESDVLQLGFSVNYIQADGDTTIVKDNGVGFVFLNGDYNDIGSIVTIGTEKFYTIGREGDNVKLFSMMNITLDDNPIQSVEAKNTPYSSDEQKGTNYSDYEGSIVEGYVNNYKSKLETKFGIEISEARLITKDELIDEKIGCSVSEKSCNDAPSFIYSTKYWTGTRNGDNLYCVYPSGLFDYFSYSNANSFAVRPVIIISKDYFE